MKVYGKEAEKALKRIEKTLWAKIQANKKSKHYKKE